MNQLLDPFGDLLRSPVKDSLQVVGSKEKDDEVQRRPALQDTGKNRETVLSGLVRVVQARRSAIKPFFEDVVGGPEALLKQARPSNLDGVSLIDVRPVRNASPGIGVAIT